MTDSVPAPALEEPARTSPQDAPAEDPSERYVQERLLGQGAMGAVYLVRDRETGEQLALKKLFRMDARSSLRLKREFRSVADMSHPNLVKVYELGHAHDGLFLAMEYVAGQDLAAYLGRSAERQTHSRIDSALAQLASQRTWLEQLLLPTFHQLASGVHALHRRGMLHRDLKPSNVLVAERRVVVLDFGLVREIDPNAPRLTEDGAISGTPAYMAPEQALGKPLTEASDWYAFGVMLYEVLTGMLPFDGTVLETLRGKLERDPIHPEKLNPETPASLSALCMALLSRDPALRPTGNDVLMRLEPARPATVSTGLQTGETSLLTEQQLTAAAPFFGRSAEMSALVEAFREVEAERSTVVHVRGVSGTGKSALVEHFLEQLERQRSPMGQAEVLVLRSRCYEREAMPFKALDGVVDALTRHLSGLPDYEVSHLLPRDVAALTQLFPVFERLRAVQRLLTVRVQLGDAIHNRQRGEAAFRELLSRLSARGPVVIWIDDLQWGDLDSTGILKGLLQRAAGQPLLLLLSYRSDEVETSECLRLLLSAAEPDRSAATRIVQVSALASSDMAALCREQLGSYASEHAVLIEHIVSESDGSPFLAAQLTALALAKLTSGARDLGSVSLADLVAQTAALVPEDARHFLSVLSVAGRPITVKLALRAAGLRRGGRDIVHALRRHLLVRTREVGGERLIEVYHDRVRESVQRAMSPAQAEELHTGLLAALEYSGRADVDWLYTHAVGAQQRPAALRYGFAAAERAMGKLAFGHAAELYAHCVELSEAAGPERAELVRKWGDALACAGRGGKAADVYLEAAQLSAGRDALELMRLATSHLLRSGRFEQGEALLQRVVVAMGLRLPATGLSLMAAVIWERLRLLMRGKHVKLKREDEVPAALLTRIDAFNALRQDLATIDPVRGAWFLLRSLRWSLDAGEPRRLLNALSGMYYTLSLRRMGQDDRRSAQLLERMKALSELLGTPAAKGSLTAIQTCAAWMRGQPEAVIEPSYEAERLCREDTTDRGGGYHLRFAVVSTRIGALYQLGDYARFAAELQSALEEARATENVAAELNLALNETLLDHIQGRVEQALERLERQSRQLPATGFSVYHALHMLSLCYGANAAGRYDWGKAQLERLWPAFQRSPIRRSLLGLTASNYRSALLLSQYAASGRKDSEVLERLRREIDKLTRTYRTSRYLTYAQMLRARLAWIEHDDARAIDLLRQVLARPRFLYTEHARYALGRVTGAAEGAQLCAESETKLAELGVADPAHFMATSYPELSERG